MIKTPGILAKINNICIAGYDAINANELFDISLKFTLDIFEAKRGSIYLLDETEKELTLKASVGLKSAEQQMMSQRLGQGIMGKVAEHKKPIRVEDITKDARFQGFPSRPAYETPSFVCAPLMLKDKVIGVINIADKGSGQSFLKEDVDLLDFITSQIALNFQRLHLNQQLKTQLGKSTEEVIVQERLASIGKLAGGIAHEFNNPLDGVMRYTNLCLEHVKEEDVVHEYLLEIKQGLKRMAHIVQSLLACARNTKPTMQKIDVNKTVEAVVKECHPYILKKGISVHKHLMKGIPELTDLGLERVIGNLLRNAVDAIDHDGTIDITTSLEHQLLKITVKDNGKGIAPENIDKVFEPFYTTKKIEQGCGLGLTIVNEVVKYYNGSVEVESPPGKGTIFTVILPI